MKQYKPGWPGHEDPQVAPGSGAASTDKLEQQQKCNLLVNTSEKPIPPEQRKATIFGLRRVTFILSVLLALGVVVIAISRGILGLRKTN